MRARPKELMEVEELQCKAGSVEDDSKGTVLVNKNYTVTMRDDGVTICVVVRRPYGGGNSYEIPGDTCVDIRLKIDPEKGIVCPDCTSEQEEVRGEITIDSHEYTPIDVFFRHWNHTKPIVLNWDLDNKPIGGKTKG